MFSPGRNRQGWCCAAAVFFILVCCGAQWVFARAGGGGSYGGGGGGGGSGGGSGGEGGGEFLVWWIVFCYHHPLIGLPVTTAVIVLMIWGGNETKNAHVARTIRKGRQRQDLQRRAAALADIKNRDPAFDEDGFLQRVSEAFQIIQTAWSRQDMSPARAFLSDGIFERFALQFQMQKAEDYRNVMQDVTVHSAQAVAVFSDAHFDTIHVEFRATARDYNERLSDGAKLAGSDISGEFVEYWSFHRRPGAKTLSRPGAIEGNCPHCGAPLEIVDRALCQACGSTVNSGEHDWVLAEITQAVEWHVPEQSTLIPGLAPLRRRDPAFSVQHIEDRVSVMFWRMRAAEFFGDVNYARPVLTVQQAALLQTELDHPPTGRRFWKDPAVGTVELLDVQPVEDQPRGGTNQPAADRLRVVVRWSGILSERSGKKGVLPLQPKRILTQVYVLLRHADVKSRPERAFSSSGCAQCGAPVAVAEEAQCPYCGAVLTSGDYDWVLEKIGRFTPEMAFAARRAAEQPADGGLPSSQEPAWELSLAVLAKMMFADGHLHDSERQKLERIGRQRGLSPSQVQAVLNTAASPANGNVEIPVPRTPQEGRAYLEQLAQAGLADGKISAAENRLMREFGSRCGLSAADVALIITRERRREYQAARKLARQTNQA